MFSTNSNFREQFGTTIYIVLTAINKLSFHCYFKYHYKIWHSEDRASSYIFI